MTGTPARRNRTALVGRLLLASVLAYLAGVGIAAAFGSADPWAFGVLGIGPALAGFFAGPRRVRG